MEETELSTDRQLSSLMNSERLNSFGKQRSYSQD